MKGSFCQPAITGDLKEGVCFDDRKQNIFVSRNAVKAYRLLPYSVLS